jgi:hypothetical protein
MLVTLVGGPFHGCPVEANPNPHLDPWETIWLGVFVHGGTKLQFEQKFRYERDGDRWVYQPVFKPAMKLIPRPVIEDA